MLSIAEKYIRRLTSEEDLIKGCIKEVSSCQQELYNRYAGKMLVVCKRYARHHQEAEDILQDGFIKVFDKIGQFNFQGSFEGWVRKVMVNTALKNYRKCSFKREDIGVSDYYDQPVDSVAAELIGERELLDLIANLPEGYRLVFNLYAIEGYSHKEIGEMLNINESTSRSQLTKARKMLQTQVNNMYSYAVSV